VLCTNLTTTCRGPITVNAPTKIVLSGDGKRCWRSAYNSTAGRFRFVIDVVLHSTGGISVPIVPVPGFHRAVTPYSRRTIRRICHELREECGGGASTAGVQVLIQLVQLTPGRWEQRRGTFQRRSALWTMGLIRSWDPASAPERGLNGGQINKLTPPRCPRTELPRSLPPGFTDTIAVQAGKVFVGSRACTVTSGPNQAVSVFDAPATVISSTYEGDVTGMQAISAAAWSM